MPMPLEYQSGGPTAVALDWQEFDGGVRLVVPPPSVWVVAVRFTILILLCFGGIAMLILTARSQKFLAPPAVLFLIFGLCVAIVYGIWRLAQLPRVGTVPTIVTASATGLEILTVRRGRIERFAYPIQTIRAFAVGDSIQSQPLTRWLRILLEVKRQFGPGVTTVALELIVPQPMPPAQLEMFLRKKLGRIEKLPAANRTLYLADITKRI